MMAWVDMTLKQEFQFLSLGTFLWFSDPGETIIFYNKIIFMSKLVRARTVSQVAFKTPRTVAVP